MPLQVSAAYKEEGRIERGKRRVNARYSLENVRFASLPSLLSIILALFFFFPSLLTFLFPPRLRNEWKFYTLHTFTTKFNDDGVSRAEKREERREREETA